MAGDLLATVHPRPVEDIGVGDRVFRIAAHPALVWLDILAEDAPNLLAIVPGLVEETDCEDHLTELLISGALDREDFERTVFDVITVAAGRYWWAALRLISAARNPVTGDWVRGNLVLHHIDARELSLAAWLDAIYAILTKHMDPDRCAKFDAVINQPPADGKAKLSRSHKRANFAAAMNS